MEIEILKRQRTFDEFPELSRENLIDEESIHMRNVKLSKDYTKVSNN